MATAFALADPYVLRSFPSANPDELVIIDVHDEGMTVSVTRGGISVPLRRSA